MTRYTKIILVLILIISFFLRVYNFKSFYVFSHDQDLASWIVKDILVNHHVRLIGQETSSQGVMIGALFYYLQAPFYLLGGMNPLPSIFLSIILGVFATYSIYFVFSKIFSTRSGLIGAFIYAVSALIVFTDREVAPTMPVVLWTVWYLYSLYLIQKNDQLKGFALWALLIGLIWHLNLALVILAPLALIAFLFTHHKMSNKKINFKAVIIGILILVAANLPLLAFEYRHNFSQTKAIVLSLTTEKDMIQGTAKGASKFDRVMQLVNKNTIGILSKNNFVRPSSVTLLLVLLFVYLVKIKKISKFWAITFVLWQCLYIAFFSTNSLNVSEYYFNGMNIIWILIFALSLAELQNTKKGKIAFYILAFLFVLTNLNNIFRHNTDKKGYVEKMALVNNINEDRIKHGYPCISISYITNPGYNLGYRYLFYIKDMHINKPMAGSTGSPVYTIVFPHSLVDKIDASFGSLGLIYPEYELYEEKDIIKSCEGENTNLTEPMFGYTQ
jgi:4-amino-4-deoxy-L-arabinose transferase-like glycosyltransferase